MVREEEPVACLSPGKVYTTWFKLCFALFWFGAVRRVSIVRPARSAVEFEAAILPRSAFRRSEKPISETSKMEDTAGDRGPTGELRPIMIWLENPPACKKDPGAQAAHDAKKVKEPKIIEGAKAPPELKTEKHPGHISVYRFKLGFILLDDDEDNESAVYCTKHELARLMRDSPWKNDLKFATRMSQEMEAKIMHSEAEGGAVLEGKLRSF
jgi:hypothetical protein